MSNAARNNVKKHQQWMQKAEAEAAKLRAENKRLERSLRQAGVEERRLVELVRAAPDRVEERLSELRAECQRVEQENQRLELDLNVGRVELTSVRDVVARESRRVGPPPRAGDPTRAPFTTGTVGQSSSSAGSCKQFARQGSSPALRMNREMC